MANPRLDNLRAASFRGVPFQVDGTGLEGGRRKQIHEYPKRDKPYVEDMGRKARSLEFDVFLVGDDIQAQVDKLLGALEHSGNGTLVHPFYGSLTVDVLTYRIRQNKALGFAELSLSFVESGELEFPAATTSTAAASRIAAGGLESSSVSAFANVFKTAGYINYVANRASVLYGQALTFLANPVYAGANLLGFGSLPGNLASLVSRFSNPIDLGWQYAGLTNISLLAKSGSLTANASTPAQQDAVLVPTARSLAAMSQDTAIAPPTASNSTSATAQQINANQVAINANTRQLLLVQAVGLSSITNAAVYDDAIALRDDLTRALDAEALIVTNDDLYQALVTARAAVFEDLTTRSRNSARLLTIKPPEVLPMLAIAYDYYEDAARDIEIVDRNRISNPNFVPVAALQVLSA